MAFEVLSQILAAFVALFAIMDPFVSLPVFVALTKKFNADKRRRSADEAVLVAGAVILIFLFAGNGLLDLLRITFKDFLVAGGIVLGVLGLQNIFTKETSSANGDYHAAAVIIGTPLITGPGVIGTTIILSNTYGLLVTGLAAAASLCATWLVFAHSDKLTKKLGPRGIEVFSKVMGLLIIAIAVSFVRSGLG